MAEPTVKNGKTRAQLDAQLARISTAVERANRGADWDEIRHNQNRWFQATGAYGRLSRDNGLISRFADYMPADRFFTSNAEIERINRHFGLEGRTLESLRALRNNVVDYYDQNYRRSSQRFDKMPWMQSITAVIDEYIRRKGGVL